MRKKQKFKWNLFILDLFKIILEISVFITFGGLLIVMTKLLTPELYKLPKIFLIFYPFGMLGILIKVMRTNWFGSIRK